MLPSHKYPDVFRAISIMGGGPLQTNLLDARSLAPAPPPSAPSPSRPEDRTGGPSCSMAAWGAPKECVQIPASTRSRCGRASWSCTPRAAGALQAAAGGRRVLGPRESVTDKRRGGEPGNRDDVRVRGDSGRRGDGVRGRFGRGPRLARVETTSARRCAQRFVFGCGTGVEVFQGQGSTRPVRIIGRGRS